jgi:flagellar biosynthesis/type III secretory pathway protein FliH
MATLKTFLFDYDFDDVQLMENIIQEETGKENEVNITDQPEPEIILPTFSEDELNAAREEGFNAGKESGTTETLASIENSISQTLSTIVDEILDLSRKQSEYNEHIKIETISLLNGVNRKLFPLMNEQLNLDEAIQFSQRVLPELLTEPRITIRVHEDISETLKNRIENFLKDKSYGGELIINGDVSISAGNCQIEWSSGSAERNPELLMSDIEKRFLSAINSNLSTQNGNDVIPLNGDLKIKTEEPKPEADNQASVQNNMIRDAEILEETSREGSSNSEFSHTENLAGESHPSRDENNGRSDDHS